MCMGGGRRGGEYSPLLYLDLWGPVKVGGHVCVWGGGGGGGGQNHTHNTTVSSKFIIDYNIAFQFRIIACYIHQFSQHLLCISVVQTGDTSKWLSLLI